MMKRLPALAVVGLMSAALAVGAASVTPASTNAYIFTTPLFPASIRGEVMGDPPAYYDPRGEDVDWVFEASRERGALIDGRMPQPGTYLEPSFGKWALSATNRFSKWATAVDASGATNVVVGYSLVTNAPRTSLSSQDVDRFYIALYDFFWMSDLGYDRSSYLDGGASLLTEARAAYDYAHAPSFTNAIPSVGWKHSAVTNVTTITMPMTNGTESVFTNRWIATFLQPVTNAVTNVVTACPLDYCHALDGPFPLFPGRLAFSEALAYPRRNGVAAQLYAALRAAVRLADTVSPTNFTTSVSYSRSKYSDADGSIITPNTYTNSNEGPPAVYRISGDSSYHASWNADRQAYDFYYGYYVSEKEYQPYEAVAPTRFKSDLVTTCGVVRVEIESAFAVVRLQYSKDHFNETVPGPNPTRDVTVDKIVVVPIETYALDLSREDALARVWLPMKALAGLAADAAGAPPPPGSAAAYAPPDGEMHSWSAECSGIVLIYKIKPSSKFDSWQ